MARNHEVEELVADVSAYARMQIAKRDAEIERLRAALEKAEPILAGAAYTEQSSPPYQQGRACGALIAVRNALAKRDLEQTPT